MKKGNLISVLAIALTIIVLMLLAVGWTQAQDQDPPEVEAPRVATASTSVRAPSSVVGTAFTYQGRLLENGEPVSETCDFGFTLYDEFGTQFGTTYNENGIDVVDGYFSVDVDFGEGVFSGDARELKIIAYCPTGSSTMINLNPRIPLNPVPYALGLRPGAVISGTGTMLTARTSTNSGWALLGQSTATTGNASGVMGDSSSPSGAGVVGTHSGSSGYGVYGTSPTTGTAGIATSGSGPTWGVYGRSSAPSGYGVYGVNTSGGTTYGVYGTNDSSSGAGVFGVSGADAGVGVRGETVDGNGIEGAVNWLAGGTGYGVFGQGGVYGYGGGFENATSDVPTVKITNLNYSAGGPALEVWGTTAITGDISSEVLHVVNTDGTNVSAAIQGENNGGYGVRGDSTSSYGVRGQSESSYGVFGQSDSSPGVYGISNGDYGVYGTSFGGGGVYGQSDEYDEAGGKFLNTYVTTEISSAVGLWAGSYYGDVIQGHEVSTLGESVDLVFRVTWQGDLYADGTLHSPAGDFAEMLPGADGLEPGDVLVIGTDGQLHRSAGAYDSNVMGVYSTEPGFVGGSGINGADAEDVPLAVVGVVPVKASTENGPIVPGDLLVTSATPGHAMAAGAQPPIGTVVGKALEGLESDTGVIMMLVMLQ